MLKLEVIFCVNVLEILGLVLLCRLFWLVCMVMLVVFCCLLNVLMFFIDIELLMVLLFIFGVMDLDIFSVWMSFEGIMFSVIECMLDFGDGMFNLLIIILFRLGLILWMLIKCFLFWFCFMVRLGKCWRDFVVFWLGNWLMVLVEIIFEILFDICCWLIVLVWLLCWFSISSFFNVLFLFNMIIGVMVWLLEIVIGICLVCLLR